MNFQNFEVTPLGNAQLSITPENTLLVSNIGNSGIDGVMVNVVGHENYAISFNEIPSVLQGGIMRIATIGTNTLNQSSTVSEKLVWYDPSINQVQYGFNMGLLPSRFTLFGKLNGHTVFEIEEQNPVSQPTFSFVAVAGLVVAVISLGVAIYGVLKTKHTRTVVRAWDDQGKLIEIIVETDDPTPFEITVGGQTYLVDYWGITYTFNFLNQDDQKFAFSDTATQITGYNLNSIEITSIV